MAITDKFKIFHNKDIIHGATETSATARFNGNKPILVQLGEPYYYIENDVVTKNYVDTDNWTLTEKRTDGICYTLRANVYDIERILYNDKISLIRGSFLAKVNSSIISNSYFYIGDKKINPTNKPGDYVVVVARNNYDNPVEEPQLGDNIKYAGVNTSNLNAEEARKINLFRIGRIIDVTGGWYLILFDL